MSRFDGSSERRTVRVAFGSGSPVAVGVVDVAVHEVNRRAPIRSALVARAVRRSIAGSVLSQADGIRVLWCRGVG
jgi:hypothetical protein